MLACILINKIWVLRKLKKNMNRDEGFPKRCGGGYEIDQVEIRGLNRSQSRHIVVSHAFAHDFADCDHRSGTIG